jgi:hypothetical protein
MMKPVGASPRIAPGESVLEIGEKSIKRKDGVVVWGLEDLKRFLAQPAVAKRIRAGELRFDDLDFLRDTLGYAGDIPTATSEQIAVAFSRAKVAARAELEAEYAAKLSQAVDALKLELAREYEAKQAEADRRYAQTVGDLRDIISSLKVAVAPTSTGKGKTKPKDDEPTPSPTPAPTQECPTPGLEGAEKPAQVAEATEEQVQA